MGTGINKRSPIKAEFANGNSTLIHQTTTATITIAARLTFLIFPIGNQIILGTPWFSSVEASIYVSRTTNKSLPI